MTDVKTENAKLNKRIVELEGEIKSIHELYSDFKKEAEKASLMKNTKVKVFRKRGDDLKELEVSIEDFETMKKNGWAIAE